MKAKIISVSSLVLVLLVGGVFWLKSQMAYTPWKFEAFHENGRVVITPDLNLGKDHIYSQEENEKIFEKVSPVKHLLDPRLGLSALSGIVTYQDQVDVGSPAPDYTLTTTNGQTISLNSLKGKIVAFMFVAMTCPPAREQLPRFDALHDKYSSDEVELFVIYSRERHAGERGYPDIKFAETEEEKFANANLLSELTDLTVAVDGIDERVLTEYGRVPNSAYVIDEEGVIAYRSTWADSIKVEQVIDYLLAN